MEFINGAKGAPKPVGAYSQAVEVGGLVFLSGQVGLDPVSGALVPGGLEAQCRQVFQNLSAVLEEAGTNASRIVMTTIFLADMADFKAVNSLYATFVNEQFPPARQTVAVKDLPLGALIEISVIAAV